MTMLPDSFFRSHNLRLLLEKKNGQIDIPYLQECLRNHRQFPNSICHHINKREAEPMQMVSVFSIIMDLNASEAWITLGPPCQNEYVHYTVAFD